MKIKKFLINVYNYMYDLKIKYKDLILKKIIGKPKVLSIDDTFNYINSQKCSVARFGDGEFKLVCGQGIRFQEYNEVLSKKLALILKEENENLLVCISDIFDSIEWMEKKPYEYTWKIVAQNRKEWTAALNKEKVYGNAFISRCYMDRKDKTNSAKWFNKMKTIWNQQDIVIIEGEKSRLGYHNDLFDNTKSIQRILCPNKNAFTSYDKILKEAKKVSKNKLILIALGPTATVLAYDLNNLGYSAIDIGHVDIEYEWFLQGATEKIAVTDKYTNEAINGDVVDDNVDSTFISQIICNIK